MKIEHASKKCKWNTPESEEKRILILGSFNPYSYNNDNVDYFYGGCTNYLWKSIADLNGHNLNYYFNDISKKHYIMKTKGFFFADLIESIEVTPNNGTPDNIIGKFLTKKI